MANRRDYYFRQKVTEAELDAGFAGLEQADWDLTVDNEMIGAVLGLGVSEKSGTPDLTVDVQGPGVAYSKNGERIAISSTQNVNVAVDDSSISTAVGSSGNEKWISVFIEFDRNLSDPRLDGNSSTVYFQRDESFVFSVVQGAEATVGAATRPSIDAGKILLADVRRTFGDTQILNAEIYTNRREDWFRDETGTVTLVAGTAHDGLGSLLTALNQHIDGTTNQHPAADVTYAGSGTWYGSITGLPTGDLETALDNVVTQLRATGTGTSGADRIGIAARSNWLGGRTNPLTSLFSAVDKIITDLAATTASDDGAERIGAAAGTNLTAGSVRSQLDELDAEKAGLALANTFTAVNTFSANISLSGGSTEVVYASPPTHGLVYSLAGVSAPASWTFVAGTSPRYTTSVDGAYLMFPIQIPHGATLNEVRVWMRPGVAEANAADQMQFGVYRVTQSNGTVSTIGSLVYVGNTTAITEVTRSSIGEVIANQTYSYHVAIRGSNNASTTADTVERGIFLGWTDPGPRNY